MLTDEQKPPYYPFYFTTPLTTESNIYNTADNAKALEQIKDLKKDNTQAHILSSQIQNGLVFTLISYIQTLSRHFLN
jgi:hypothetical protein